MKLQVYVKTGSQYELEPKVYIECKQETQRVKEIVDVLQTMEKKLIGILERKEYILAPMDVLFAESVDGVTYLYTKENVFRTTNSLVELEELYSKRGFFRCAKSTVINISKIVSLKSEIGNRIDALLANGEHIMISRRYAKEFRAILKGGDDT